MKKLTSMAEFKRLLKVGEQVHSIYHMLDGKLGEGGKPIYEDGPITIREIQRVQTNAFTLKTWQPIKQQFVESWCHLPKTSECVFQNNMITIMDTDREGIKRKMLTYWFSEIPVPNLYEKENAILANKSLV